MSNENIVIQLQEDTINPNTDIVSLLRKAYLIARKLKLKDFEQWINYELNGYPKDYASDKLPHYRHITGDVNAYNPFHGWQPILFENIEMSNILQNQIVYDSIPNLQSTLIANRAIFFSFPPEKNSLLNQLCNYPTKFALFVSHNSISNILEIVKNHVLDWAITLEEDGILGEGLVFTEKEKEIAVNSSIINNYTNNFFESISNTQLQQGTSESMQNK